MNTAQCLTHYIYDKLFVQYEDESWICECVGAARLTDNGPVPSCCC